MRRIAILIFYTFLTVLTYAQADYTRDLDTFAATLISKHKNLFAHITKTQFDRQIEETRQQLKNGALDKAHFIIALMKINAQIADEHTLLFPLSSGKFPFEFYFFNEGIVLVKADSNFKHYLLHELVAIDGTPTAEVLARLKTCIKTDNESYFKQWSVEYINYPDVLKGLDIIHSQDSAIFSFKSTDGEVNNVTINTQPKSAPPFSSKKQTGQLRYSQNRNYWYSLDTTRNILYFNYEHCMEDSTLNFSDFNTQLFKTIKKNKPTALVLDLRQNGGGNSAILSSFIKQIRSNYLNTPHKFFVLIGRQTFSSALMNAIEIKQKTSAEFIGEPTGGNMNHFGELRTFSLPETKLFITYSTKYFENWKGKEGPLLPDYAIPNSSADLLNNQDSCLEMVYQLYK